jgi:hypothetical protein
LSNAAADAAFHHKPQMQNNIPNTHTHSIQRLERLVGGGKRNKKKKKNQKILGVTSDSMP